MSKVFNAYEKATIKNTAKEVARLGAKQEKLREQLKAFTDKVEAEIKEIDETISQYESNVQTITGGYAASELCEKVNDLWVFKYPNTIIPAVEQNEHLYEEEVTLKDQDAALVNKQEKEKEEEEEKEEPSKEFNWSEGLSMDPQNPSGQPLEEAIVHYADAEDFEDYEEPEDGDVFTEDEFN